MKVLVYLLAFVVLTAGPLGVLAQGTETGGGGGGGTETGGGGNGGTETGGGTETPDPTLLVNPLKVDSLEGLLTLILEAVIDIGTIILVLAIVYVGFKFVIAQGSEEKIREARSALVWTVIGGLILLGANAIMLVIRETAANL